MTDEPTIRERAEQVLRETRDLKPDQALSQIWSAIKWRRPLPELVESPDGRRRLIWPDAPPRAAGLPPDDPDDPGPSEPDNVLQLFPHRQKEI